MTLLYDRPLDDPSDDVLGRAPFARSIADAIVSMDATEGFVFAIHGPWGSGKTTALNFILHELQRHDPNPATVVRFNPWWFSGRDQLIQQFFNAFRDGLGSKSQASQIAGLAEDLDRFSRALTPLTLVPSLGEPMRGLRAILGGLSESGRAIADAMATDAHAIRQEIDGKLRIWEGRVLVVIDDLDRLPVSEIRQVFQLVKAVADFPKTVYLLAYDHDLVSRALDQEQLGQGEDYLAKIVQAPFDLPPPPRSALNQLLFRQLDEILKETPEHLFDQVAWGNLFMDGIRSLIQTPRDVKRLVNAVRPSYPPVRNEVSAHEFIALQAVRVFAPASYSRMALAKDVLAGEISVRPRQRDPRDAWREEHENLLSHAPEQHREVLDALMKRLFPRWEYACGGSTYGANWLPRWRREGRACSPQVFDLFFRLSLPEEGIGLQEYQELIALADDPACLSERLLNMASIALSSRGSKARLFLEGIQDFADEGIPMDAIPGFLEGLWRAGDGLLIPTDGRGMFSTGNDMQMLRITRQLLSRIVDLEQRFDILRVAIEQGSAVQLAAHEVAIDYQGLDEHPDVDDHLFERSQVDDLREIVLSQIKDAAESNALFDCVQLGYMLYRWEEWDPGAAKEWARDVAKDDRGFARLVWAFSSETFSQRASDYVVRSQRRVSLDGLESFLELTEDQLEARAARILESPPSDLRSEEFECMRVLAAGEGKRSGQA